MGRVSDEGQAASGLGARLLLGLMPIAGGLVGFRSVVGFWMLLLGIAVAALDVKPVLAWVCNRRCAPHVFNT
ncbi:MAG: hypothetical protein COW55_03130 [Rhodobacteraceae bacterium CG17_big_fil_post_rev_8_21_14_2_50_65_11]|nr:MAG: hypothetical protein COW55_03130 [Rhodobacteraceae bacterium CG17_big_fil_post_rev_8_21_14_2_50_65_11]